MHASGETAPRPQPQSPGRRTLLAGARSSSGSSVGRDGGGVGSDGGAAGEDGAASRRRRTPGGPCTSTVKGGGSSGARSTMGTAGDGAGQGGAEQGGVPRNSCNPLVERVGWSPADVMNSQRVAPRPCLSAARAAAHTPCMRRCSFSAVRARCSLALPRDENTKALGFCLRACTASEQAGRVRPRSAAGGGTGAAGPRLSPRQQRPLPPPPDMPARG